MGLLPNIEMNDIQNPAIKHCPSKLRLKFYAGAVRQITFPGQAQAYKVVSTQVSVSLQLCVEVSCRPSISLNPVGQGHSSLCVGDLVGNP